MGEVLERESYGFCLSLLEVDADVFWWVEKWLQHTVAPKRWLCCSVSFLGTNGWVCSRLGSAPYRIYSCVCGHTMAHGPYIPYIHWCWRRSLEVESRKTRFQCFCVYCPNSQVEPSRTGYLPILHLLGVSRSRLISQYWEYQESRFCFFTAMYPTWLSSTE